MPAPAIPAGAELRPATLRDLLLVRETIDLTGTRDADPGAVVVGLAEQPTHSRATR